MDKVEVSKMLAEEYMITLNGGTLGYLLSVLAEEQGRLEEKARGDDSTVMELMAAQANNIVGNTLLEEIYKVAGAKFLAFAMGIDVETMTNVMETKDKTELAKIVKKRQQEKNMNIN